MDIFRDKNDYERFLKKFAEYNNNIGVGVLVFSLMPNHFHYLLYEPETIIDDGQQFLISGTIISRLMHLVLTSHAKYFCWKYNHSGYLFQGRFQNKVITDMSYLKTVVQYILDNPVRKGYVKRYQEWPYCGVDEELINKLIN
jgi:REP element-mobilizing transposase RayT